jgi:parallel beta-helix repeat protein
MKKVLFTLLAAAILTALIAGAFIYSQANSNNTKLSNASLSPEPNQSPPYSPTSENPTPSSPISPSPSTFSSPSASPSPSPSSLPTVTLPSTPTVFDIVVPDNYSSIQQAVNDAAEGAAILVRAGLYNEAVTINKSLWLVGEDKQITTVDAHSAAPSIFILADRVNITGFHVINTPIPAQGNPWFSWEYVPSKQLPSIQINRSSDCNIYGNLFTNGSIGVDLSDSSKNRVLENVFSFNGEGVYISGQGHYVAKNQILNYGAGGTGLVIDSSHNVIVNNTVVDGTGGIWFKSGENNTLRENVMKGNFISILMGYIEPWLSFDNDVDASNTVDGKPVYYWIGRTGETVPSDAGAVILVNSTDMTVKDLVLPQNTYGIILANTNGSTVENNKLAPQSQEQLDYYHTPGVPLYVLLLNSSDNQLKENRATLWLNSSSANTLTGNTGVVRLNGSNNNLIANNTVTKIGFMSIDWSGVVLTHSSNNTIIGNNISDNSAGVGVDEGATFNRIIDNHIHGNAQGGIVLGTMGPGTKNNLIYGNNINDNGNEGILDSAYGTQIIGNSIAKNRGNGLELSNSVNCTITGNVIEGFFFGMYRNSAVNCTMVANNVSLNTVYGQYGIWFQSEMPGTFYHNNFISPISFDHSNYTANFWDNGNEGNWWYFYTGIDANGDGIGDTPYEIGPNNIDYYPLISPYDITTANPKNAP